MIKYESFLYLLLILKGKQDTGRKPWILINNFYFIRRKNIYSDLIKIQNTKSDILTITRNTLKGALKGISSFTI